MLCTDRLWEFRASNSEQRLDWIATLSAHIGSGSNNGVNNGVEVHHAEQGTHFSTRFEGWVIKREDIVKNWKRRCHG